MVADGAWRCVVVADGLLGCGVVSDGSWRLVVVTDGLRK